MDKQKGFLIALVLVIVLFIVVFSIIGGTAENLTDAGDSITDANNCSLGTDAVGSKLVYNISDKYCHNSSGYQEYVAKQYDLPLNTLFSSSGVVLLILMASLLIVLIILALKFGRKE